MDHHRAPGAVCGRADGWTLLPVRRSHRPAVQDLGAQQGRGDHRRAFWTRERWRDGWKRTFSAEASRLWCLTFFPFFPMQSAQQCFIKEGPGWSCVGKAGRNWKSWPMIWRKPRTPPRCVENRGGGGLVFESQWRKLQLWSLQRSLMLLGWSSYPITMTQHVVQTWKVGRWMGIPLIISAQTRKSYYKWLNGKEREIFFLFIFFASDFPLKAGAAGLRGHGQHARGHHRDPGVLRLPRHPHPQQQHEAQSPCADHISGDGQADHGPQLLRAGHSGQRYDRLWVPFGRERDDSDHKCCWDFPPQVFCPPWSPGEPATYCWSTASRGNSRCLSAPLVSEKSATYSLHLCCWPGWTLKIGPVHVEREKSPIQKSICKVKALLKDTEEMSRPDLPHLSYKIKEIPPSPPDAASKHAVQAFFDCLRAEVNEYGISVSTISHTYISSSLSKHTGAAPARSIWSCEYKHIIATY